MTDSPCRSSGCSHAGGAHSIYGISPPGRTIGFDGAPSGLLFPRGLCPLPLPPSAQPARRPTSDPTRLVPARCLPHAPHHLEDLATHRVPGIAFGHPFAQTLPVVLPERVVPPTHRADRRAQQ